MDALIAYIIAAVVAALGGWAAYLRGKSVARNEARAAADADYRDTTKRINDAQDSLGDDPDVLRDFLRQRGK